MSTWQTLSLSLSFPCVNVPLFFSVRVRKKESRCVHHAHLACPGKKMKKDEDSRYDEFCWGQREIAAISLFTQQLLFVRALVNRNGGCFSRWKHRCFFAILFCFNWTQPSTEITLSLSLFLSLSLSLVARTHAQSQNGGPRIGRETERKKETFHGSLWGEKMRTAENPVFEHSLRSPRVRSNKHRSVPARQGSMEAKTPRYRGPRVSMDTDVSNVDIGLQHFYALS